MDEPQFRHAACFISASIVTDVLMMLGRARRTSNPCKVRRGALLRQRSVAKSKQRANSQPGFRPGLIAKTSRPAFSHVDTICASLFCFSTSCHLFLRSLMQLSMLARARAIMQCGSSLAMPDQSDAHAALTVSHGPPSEASIIPSVSVPTASSGRSRALAQDEVRTIPQVQLIEVDPQCASKRRSGSAMARRRRTRQRGASGERMGRG
ncbi:hypothetical protein ACVWW1_008918 [Bradyrhizobium sp. JR3.5]